MKIFKLGIVLGIYAAISCLCLALVNNFTAPVIAERALQKEKEGLKIIFSDATDFVMQENENLQKAISNANITPPSIKVLSLYKAVIGNDTIGYVAKLTGPTYESSTLLVGLDLENKIKGVHILSSTDSPGYGQKAIDPKYNTSKGKTFYGQFAGLAPLDSFTANIDYEIISGATISSNGFAAIIMAGSKVIAEFAKSDKAL